MTCILWKCHSKLCNAKRDSDRINENKWSRIVIWSIWILSLILAFIQTKSQGRHDEFAKYCCKYPLSLEEPKHTFK